MVKNHIIQETTSKLHIVCAGCENTAWKYRSQVKVGVYAFCSLSCRNKNYKIVNESWRPPNYKGQNKFLCEGCNTTFFAGRNTSSNRKYCSKSCSAKHIKRQPLSDKTKAKLSKAAAEQCRKYGGKCLYIGPNGPIKMRSNWEVKYAAYLDSIGVKWEYEPEGYLLSNGYTYIPDFKLGTGVIIEIKGWWREDARVKWDLFCTDYKDIQKQVLMKTDLKKLGIL